MAAIVQQSTQDSLDILEDKIEYLLKFVTIISELVLLVGLGYAGFKLAHRGATPETLDQIWLVSQVLALDLSAPGLFAMAKQAKDQGEEQRAAWAIKIAIILIVMSILTMVEGAVTSYLPGIPQAIILYVTLAMMIIRGGAAVGYSVFRRLHKTERQSVTPAQPIASAPAAAQPIDYAEIARQLLPLVVAPIQELRSEVKGQIERLSEQVVSLQSVQSAHGSETAIEPEREPEQENIVNLQSYREVHGDETTNETADEPETRPRPRITVNLKQERSAAKRETKREPAKGSGTAQEKAARILKRTPEITASELAKRAGCTPQYAGRLRKKQGV